MTKQEILDALEGLKDFVNHVGKQSIDGLKAAILKDLTEIMETQAQEIPVPPMIKEPEEEDTHGPEEREAQEGEKLEGHPTKTKVKIVSHGTKRKVRLK